MSLRGRLCRPWQSHALHQSLPLYKRRCHGEAVTEGLPKMRRSIPSGATRQLISALRAAAARQLRFETRLRAQPLPQGEP